MKNIILICLISLSHSVLFAQFNWQSVEITQSAFLKKMHVFDDNHAIIAGYKSTLKKSNDGGFTWNNVQVPDTITKLGVVNFSDMQFNANIGILTHKKILTKDLNNHDFYINSQLLLSLDEGDHWAPIDYSGTSDGSNNSASDAFADSSYALEIRALGITDKNELYIHLWWFERSETGKIDHNYIFNSLDTGKTWSKAIPQDLESRRPNTIIFNGERGYIGGPSILYVKDANNEWNNLWPILLEQNSDSSISINNFTITDNNNVIITTASDGIFTYNATASTIKKISDTGSNDAYYFGYQQILTLGTPSKTKHTRDWGQQWSLTPNSSALYKAGGIMGDYFFALGIGTISYFNVKDLALSIAPIQTNNLQISLLTQNQFQTKSDQRGMVIVYSLRGNICMEEPMEVGTSTIDANMLDRGIYIISAQTPNGKVSQKIFIQ